LNSQNNIIESFGSLNIVTQKGADMKYSGILGFHNWKDPGATNTYLRGGGTGKFIAFWKVIVLSAFPFTFAPELLVVTGGEMKSPRRNLPKAAKRYFYRLGMLSFSYFIPFAVSGYFFKG
jgi:amino acid transporter